MRDPRIGPAGAPYLLSSGMQHSGQDAGTPGRHDNGPRPVITPHQAELIERHLPLARSIARRYLRRGLDIEDLEQEAARGLVDAALSYDFSAHGAAFATYARPKCRMRIADAIAVSAVVHGSERFERDPASERWTRSPIPIDEYGFMPEDDDASADEMLEHVEAAMAECTGTQQAVIRLYRGLQGTELTMTEIAERMGISRRRAMAEHDAGCLVIAGVFRRNRWPVA
jgi:RNA polymerase sigma-B factor